tara:strand:+ start:439 stop:1731 length:1293 start_codon:yes stop_codon:yes gene_type:complete
MSRNGSGTYSAPVNSWNPAVNGVSATSSDYQALLDDIVAALTASVCKDGQTTMTGNLPMGGFKLTGLAAGSATGNSARWEQLFDQGIEADIASATTTDIGAQNTNFLSCTGTTTITSFGTNYKGPRFIRFTGALLLTHNASTLILPGAANITTAAGDSLIAIPKATTGTADGWKIFYQKANGQAVVSSTDYLNTTRADVASATTTDLTANAPNTRNINITGTTTITGFTVAIGQLYFVRFNAALTLTNNAAIVTQTGADITTAAGDTCILRATAANTVEVLSYVGYSTTTQRGVVELATSAEAIAGTDAVRAITPATLFGGLNAGGTAPIYAARAWVNFNGTGTVAIRASGNVTSITDNGVGDYTVNFTNAMSDANFACGIAYAPTLGGTGAASRNVYLHTKAVGSVRVISLDNGGAASDFQAIDVIVAR